MRMGHTVWLYEVTPFTLVESIIIYVEMLIVRKQVCRQFTGVTGL